MATVETNGIETYDESHGEGPPVVFVHAAILGHGFWAPKVEALSTSYQVTTDDLRGHGRTGGSGEAAYTIGLDADDLDALLGFLDRLETAGESTPTRAHASSNGRPG